MENNPKKSTHQSWLWYRKLHNINKNELTKFLYLNVPFIDNRIGCHEQPNSKWSTNNTGSRTSRCTKFSTQNLCRMLSMQCIVCFHCTFSVLILKLEIEPLYSEALGSITQKSPEYRFLMICLGWHSWHCRWHRNLKKCNPSIRWRINYSSNSKHSLHVIYPSRPVFLFETVKNTNIVPDDFPFLRWHWLNFTSYSFWTNWTFLLWLMFNFLHLPWPIAIQFHSIFTFFGRNFIFQPTQNNTTLRFLSTTIF